MRISLGFRALLLVVTVLSLLPGVSRANEGMELCDVSDVAGIRLVSAQRITDTTLREPIYQQLDRMARDMGRACRSPEALVWTGAGYRRDAAKTRIAEVTDSLRKAGYDIRLQEAGRSEDSDMTVIVVRGPDSHRAASVTITGMFCAGDDALLLGWCRLDAPGMATLPPAGIIGAVNRAAASLERLPEPAPGEGSRAVIARIVNPRARIARGAGRRLR